MKQRNSSVAEWALCIAVSLMILGFAVKPLFHAGLFPTIDNISVVRLEAMAKTLQSGQFPVRYVPSLARGHGYMLFNYYAPLPFYSGALMHAAGVNLVGALKRTYLVAFVLGAAGVFGVSAEFFGPVGAAVSSAVFMFSPFLGYDIYWRGGLGEAWAMSLVPWVLWFIYRAAKRQHRIDVVIAGVSWAGVLLSHNLTAFMAFPFIGVWAAGWAYYFRRSLWQSIMIAVIGFGVAAFFWLPALMDHGQVWVSYLQAGRDDLFKNFVWGTPENVLFPTFIPMITNWFAFFVPIGLYMLLWRLVRDRLVRFAGGLAIGLFFLALFLASGFSRPVWNLLFPVMYIFQFPWRFLTMVTVFGAFVTGAVAILPTRYRVIGSVVVILAAVLVNWANFRPRTYEFVDRYLPEDPCGTSWGFEYLPVWVTTCLKTSWEKPYRIAAGDIHVISVNESAAAIDLIVEGTGSGTLETSRYYYPGWQGYVDEHSVAVTPSYPYGLIEMTIPSGRHRVRFSLQPTPLQRASNLLSLGTAVGAVAYVCKRTKRKK